MPMRRQSGQPGIRQFIRFAGMPIQVLLGHEAHQRETAVRAVVAIVAHEEIMTRRHDGIEIRGVAIGCEHDYMLFRAEALQPKFARP